MTRTHALLGIAILLWGLAAFVFLYPTPQPFVDLGRDTVSPLRVKPGGSITVTRNIRILREEKMRITRVLVRGNCAVSCDIIDMPSGTLALPVGEYLHLSREHIIPMNVQTGKWRFVSTVTWKDRIGRDKYTRLNDLTIEVVDGKPTS